MNTQKLQPIIEEAIRLAGGTQKKLAEAACTSQNTVHKLLHGKIKSPTLDLSRKLEAAVEGKISRYDFMEMQQSEKANSLPAKHPDNANNAESHNSVAQQVSG